MRPEFLELDDVLALHSHQIGRFGGLSGVRDLGLLQSAVATPAATFAGAYLHSTLFEMAAAYLFHLARNHPFVDGNKRVALAAALVFLRLNGFRVEAEEDDVHELVMSVAEGRSGKADVAVALQRWAVRVKKG